MKPTLPPSVRADDEPPSRVSHMTSIILPPHILEAFAEMRQIDTKHRNQTRESRILLGKPWYTLKDDDALRRRLGIGNKKSDFAAWAGEKSPWFTVVQGISNGSKHFIRQYDKGIEQVAGYGMGGYGQGPFGKSYLAIDMQTEDARFLPLSFVFEVVIRFWRDFFKACGKGAELPVGKTPLSN